MRKAKILPGRSERSFESTHFEQNNAKFETNYVSMQKMALKWAHGKNLRLTTSRQLNNLVCVLYIITILYSQRDINRAQQEIVRRTFRTKILYQPFFLHPLVSHVHMRYF